MQKSEPRFKLIKTILTLSTILILFSSYSVQASGDLWKQFAKCGSNLKKDTAAERLRLDTTAIAKSLHPEPFIQLKEELEVECGLLLTEIEVKDGENRLMAAYETSLYHPSEFGGAKEIHRTLYLGVFALASSLPEHPYPPRLLSQAGQTFQLPNDNETESFDSNGYKITPEQSAFGIKTRLNRSYAGGGGANEYLLLFTETHRQIIPILNTLMKSTAILGGEWKENGEREHIERGNPTGASMKVLETKTNGYFDLKKWIDKDNGDPQNQQVFRWNGNTYQASGVDPVENVNLN